MVSRLHGPDLIPAAAKRLSGIGFPSNIHQAGLSIKIQNTGSQVVMVMAFGIMTSFGRKKETFCRTLIITGTGRRVAESYEGDQGGAPLLHVLGYKASLWNSGNLDAFNLVKEDADVLIPWTTLLEFGFNNLYLSGNGIASSMVSESASEPSARALLEDITGTQFTCGTFRDLNCPGGTPLNLAACVNVDPVSGAVVSTRPLASAPLAQGNGCPQLRSFDVLIPNPSPNFGIAIGEEAYSTSVVPWCVAMNSRRTLGTPYSRAISRPSLTCPVMISRLMAGESFSWREGDPAWFSMKYLDLWIFPMSW